MRGGATRGAAKLVMPELSGSEKQVSWATDILRSPFDTMGLRAKSLEKNADVFDKTKKGSGERERKEADAYKAAQRRYAQEVENLKKQFPSGMKASQVIFEKGRINTIANRIIQDEYKKRGFMAYEAGKV